MPTPKTPQFARAEDLLADGRWHERETLVRELAKVIPVGVALRYTESRRLAKARKRIEAGFPSIGAEQGRKVERSTNFRAATGRRRLAFVALARFERRIDVDGTVWVRDQRLSHPPEDD